MMKLTPLQLRILKTIADAKSGEISGQSIACWLNKSRDTTGLFTSIRSLVKKEYVNEQVKATWPQNHDYPVTSLSLFSLTEKGKEALNGRL